MLKFKHCNLLPTVAAIVTGLTFFFFSHEISDSFPLHLIKSISFKVHLLFLTSDELKNKYYGQVPN